MFFWFFLLFICFFSGKDALNPGWLSERFPTEVRATAAGFVYHQGAVWGAAVAPILTYFAVNQNMGFAKPMMYGVIAYDNHIYHFGLPGAGNQGQDHDRRFGSNRGCRELGAVFIICRAADNVVFAAALAVGEVEWRGWPWADV